MEVRYIVFSTDEARTAVVTSAQRQGTVATANDILGVDFAGPNDAPSALLRLRGSPAAELDAQHLIAALLLYCGDRRIPIPRRAEKRVERSVHGLTLVLTSDRPFGTPIAAARQVAYGEIATRATNELSTVKEELSRALARASYAEDLAAEAEERARRAEAARSRATSMLVSIANLPGLRGRLGRWLVRYSHP
ncbi:MAG TPA: hypothetical protein VH855_22495 [Acetobacteraceae bacterium]|jgi:hypothetical protein